MLNNLFGAFTGTGAPFAYAIVLVFAYGLTIWIERSKRFRDWTVDSEALWTAVASQDWNTANDLTVTHPANEFIQIAKKSSSPTWDDMAVVAPLIEDKVTERISALSMVANISTMLGLLGTVYGLIYALEGLDDASNIERTARLSAGIGAAMLTTAWGLIAGLPMMFAHNVLQRKSDSILAQCQSLAAQIIQASKQD